MERIKLRAGKEKDLPRLYTLFQRAFPERGAADLFLQTCFVPGRVENNLVLLDDDGVESALLFLPTFYYDGDTDEYAPAPYLAFLATNEEKRRRGYAGWLVETACDFLREKGAGAVWTISPGIATMSDLFFVRRGFWRMDATRCDSVSADAFPVAHGTIRRAAAEEYDGVRERILRGRSHIVYGAETVSFLQHNIERHGGGLFILEMDGGAACAAAFPCGGGTVRVCELLCDTVKRPAALALLDSVFHAASYVDGDLRCGYMMKFHCTAALEVPRAYLGCGVLL